MDEKTLEFQTIDRASNPVLYKDKGSKFFAYAFPIINESDVKRFITILKEKHKTAGHFCYAYRFGASGLYLSCRMMANQKTVRACPFWDSCKPEI